MSDPDEPTNEELGIEPGQVNDHLHGAVQSLQDSGSGPSTGQGSGPGIVEDEVTGSDETASSPPD